MVLDVISYVQNQLVCVLLVWENVIKEVKFLPEVLEDASSLLFAQLVEVAVSVSCCVVVVWSDFTESGAQVLSQHVCFFLKVVEVTVVIVAHSTGIAEDLKWKEVAIVDESLWSREEVGHKVLKGNLVLIILVVQIQIIIPILYL